MLDRIAGNGVRVILVESPDRFARDLAVQLAGHDYLKRLGVELVPTSAPDFFIDGHPDRGAGAAGARRNLAIREGEPGRQAQGGARAQEGGRWSRLWPLPLREEISATVALAKELHGQRMSLREISAALAAQGHVTGGGKPYTASAVQTMLHRK